MCFIFYVLSVKKSCLVQEIIKGSFLVRKPSLFDSSKRKTASFKEGGDQSLHLLRLKTKIRINEDELIDTN